MCCITDHAVDRYIERIAPISRDDARDAILSSRGIIDQAAAFGCDTVKLSNGATLRLVGDVVVTVLPKRGR